MEDGMSLKHALVVSTFLIGFTHNAMAQAPAAQPAAPAAAIPAPVAAAAAPASSAPITRQELPALVREIIIKDPEMILEAVKILREKQAAETKKKATEAIIKNKDLLLNDAATASIGDAKTADISVVEFFDYHCGYCRTLLPTITKIFNEDKKVRFVFKELPILGDDSVTAARAALAVHRIAKEKYFDFHTALMSHEGEYSEKELQGIAKKLGIDPEKLKVEMAKPEITAELDKTRKLAEELGIRGTPGLIIGDTLSPGALSYEDFKKAIAEGRSGKPAEVAPAAKLDLGSDKKEPVAPVAPAPAKQ